MLLHTNEQRPLATTGNTAPSWRLNIVSMNDYIQRHSLDLMPKDAVHLDRVSALNAASIGKELPASHREATSVHYINMNDWPLQGLRAYNARGEMLLCVESASLTTTEGIKISEGFFAALGIPAGMLDTITRLSTHQYVFILEKA